MKTYNKQSRKQKKLSYIQLKNQIKKGHFFSSHDVFTPKMQWADIYFFGTNKKIYNATIRTTACALHDEIHEKSWDKLKSSVDENDSFFEIVELDGYTSDKNMSGPTTISNPHLESLKGLTASEFLEKTEKGIANEKTHYIKESFEILPNYTYGIGLDMVIHVQTLTPENINEAIKKFIYIGEQNWQSEQSYLVDYDEKINFTTNSISLD